MKLFDLDGTLLDSNGIWEEIDLRFLAKRGIPWSKEYHEGVIHAIFPVAARFTREFCHLDESEEEIMAEWLEMAYDAYAHSLPAKEGAAEYLSACAARGERLALYTSAEPSLAKAALARFGWDRFLHPFLFAQELGMTKGTPGAFAAAARALGTPLEEIEFFDDSPVACRAAKEAGCRVTGVQDRLFAAQEGEMRALCDRYIRSFRELL